MGRSKRNTHVMQPDIDWSKADRRILVNIWLKDMKQNVRKRLANSPAESTLSIRPRDVYQLRSQVFATDQN